MEQIISAGLAELGLMGRIPADAPTRLARYGQLLLEKNQRPRWGRPPAHAGLRRPP